MAYCARLAGELSVFCDGRNVGPAPTRVCAVLLVGLLDKGDCWLNRREVSRRLYPHQDDASALVALRQTIRRMKSWLGDEAILSTSEHIRLGDAWTVDFGGSGVDIGAGLQHPWLEDIRSRRMPRSPLACMRDEHLLQAVRTTAAVDPAEGRNLLLGCRAFLFQLPVGEVGSLLRLTKPNPGEQCDHHFWELRAMYHYGCCQFAEAERYCERTYTMAVAAGAAADAQRIASFAIFLLAETGVDCGTTRWRERLKAPSTGSIQSSNAIAADAWNRGDHESAIELMQNSLQHLPSASRQERLHFLTNFAVLTAESGRFSQSMEAEAQLLEVGLSDLDTRWKEILTFAKAFCAIGRNDPDEAIRILEEREYGWTVANVYRREALALAYASKGDRAHASANWSAASSLRGAGSGVNSRRKRLRHRLQSYLG